MMGASRERSCWKLEAFFDWRDNGNGWFLMDFVGWTVGINAEELL